MSDFNRVYIIGVLVKAPALALTKSKKSVINLTVATNLTKASTLFVEVKQWNTEDDSFGGALLTAEPGDRVFIKGKLGKDYRQPEKLIINAQSINLLEKRSSEVVREIEQEVQTELLKDGIDIK